ncbi:MAG: MFS transporter [Chloroflexi bacterium]|nr:MFS transporter [Chloroflexota bacterium]
MRMPRLAISVSSPNAVLVTVCAGVFLASLDQTSVVTALPEIMLDLGITVDRLDDLAWIVTAYLLGFTVAMPLLGRAGDVYGYRRLYIGATLVFGAGSVLVALAPSLGWLIGARVVQAVGGGALIPAAIALASERFPAARRPIVFGIVGAAAEMGAVLGPLYGGTIIHLLGWRWIFWTNLPVVVVLLGAVAAVPVVRAAGGRLDVRGGVLLAAGLALVTLALSQRSFFQGGSVLPYALGAAGIVAFLLLARVERGALEPVISRALFLSRRFAAAMSAQLLVGGALIMALVTVPLMTDTVLGESPLEGGLRLMRFTGAIPIGAIAGGYAARWLGPRIPTLVGLVIGALGLWLMSTWDVTIQDPALTLHLVTGGLGFGLVIAPLVVSAVDAADDAYRGTAAAWITVARMLGMTLGLAALSAWGMGYFQLLTTDFAFPLGGSAEALSAYEAGVTGAALDVFSAFFRAGAALSLVAIVPALFLPGREGPGHTSTHFGV